jgi:hypothetical protein
MEAIFTHQKAASCRSGGCQLNHLKPLISQLNQMCKYCAQKYLNFIFRWSYAVLLYELFSFGEIPYAGHGNGDVLPFLESGKRLQKTDYCTNEM